MNQSAIPVLDPTLFVEQFVTPEAHEQARQLRSTNNPQTSPTNFFTLMRIEDFARHITFPIPTSRSFHYDFMFLTAGFVQRTYGLDSYTIGRDAEPSAFRGRDRSGMPDHGGPASPAMFSVYRAGDIISTDACSADAAGFYGLFDADYVLAMLKKPRALDELNFLQLDASPVLATDADTTQDWLAQLVKMERALTSQRPDSQAYVGSLLYAFLLDVQQQYGQRVVARSLSSSAQFTARFRLLLTQHILSKRTVHDYADLLSVTPNHLNKCVKETTGKPASVLIANMLLLEAKVLLGQPGLTISEIAFRLSFDDLSYFARFFKKHTGLNPTDYRQQT
ncbi:helix-turn-helix domain-containing protein [Spirosoma spitsbergense]|uniref:helix-turn-helix domain-containing protein n=1 Tax=Spirosoma spitsbergense TaxID=431554 RepID=UPI0003753CBA|nr:helix-turn-helix domain-containing protein [Spirosoma spitsbergense]